MSRPLSPVQVVHQLLLERIRTARILVDATAGNGHDTLFLALNSPGNAKIFAFDIQAVAIENTQRLLWGNQQAGKVQLIHDSHTRLADYVQEKADVILFNLGYLPRGNKTITTCSNHTMSAVKTSLQKLNPNGSLGVVAYPGHAAGALEAEALAEYLQSLPTAEFSVVCIKMFNHQANVPIAYIVEKLRE